MTLSPFSRRDNDLTNWIAEVRPELLKSLIKDKVFVGLTRCRISEYLDVTQCFKCLGFGHTMAKCNSEFRCKHCSESHDSKLCTKQESLKCFNCKGKHEATDRACPERDRRLCDMLRRTTYSETSETHSPKPQ